MNILMPVVLFVLVDKALGQQEGIFIAKHRDAIQKYIMTGHEEGWQHCDILSENPSYMGVPQISIKLEKIKTLNIKSAFENSHCLLVNYDISSNASLSTILEFGLEAIEHVRLAVVIKMHSGLTLEAIEHVRLAVLIKMNADNFAHRATNISNLPYLVAAESENGMEQFHCPTVGEIKPCLRYEMCYPTYLNHKNKALRIGLLGVPPDLVFTSTGVDGTNIRLIKTMAERLEFIPEIKFATSFIGAIYQVCQVLD